MMSTTIDPPTTARPRSARWAPGLLCLLVAAATLTGCLSTPGDTSQISFVSTTTTGGWTYDYYRNNAYGCSISGYQTFVIATKVGSDAAATRPLWVKMHGGGFGWFDVAGNPKPAATNKTEESRSSLINQLTGGLSGEVGAAPQGFRMMAVSMCSHDIYAGTNTIDPNNPNTLPDGTPRTTNGLLATKAAVQFATDLYPTDDFFLLGGSAGSVGSFHVAWGLQLQGLAPAGIVADSGIINQAWEQAQTDQGLDCARADAVTIALTRWDSDVADPNNQPDLAVADGRLATPILHVWNHADHNVCGALQMTCPLRDGTTVTMGSADCLHEPMRRAIEAQGPTSRSSNMALCVDDPARVGDCDQHVPSGKSTLTNTDEDFPADYNAAMLDWVEARLADD